MSVACRWWRLLFVSFQWRSRCSKFLVSKSPVLCRQQKPDWTWACSHDVVEVQKLQHTKEMVPLNQGFRASSGPTIRRHRRRSREVSHCALAPFRWSFSLPGPGSRRMTCAVGGSFESYEWKADKGKPRSHPMEHCCHVCLNFEVKERAGWYRI